MSAIKKASRFNQTIETIDINNENIPVDVSIDSLYYDFLIQINCYLIKSKNYLSVHSDSSDNQLSVYLTSKQKIDRQINKTVSKLNAIKGVNSQHKIAAYAHISTQLINELNSTNYLTNYLSNYQSINLSTMKAKEADKQKLSTNLTKELTMKEQIISQLVKEQIDKQMEKKQLDVTIQSIRYQLEKSIVEHSKLSQSLVELRLRCLDYKNQVDVRLDLIDKKITNQLGYLPAAIDKEIGYLKMIKAPCHRDYDKSRVASMLDKANVSFNLSNSFQLDSNIDSNINNKVDNKIDSQKDSQLYDELDSQIDYKIQSNDKKDNRQVVRSIDKRFDSPIRSNRWMQTVIKADSGIE